MAAEAARILKKKESILSLEKHLERKVVVILENDDHSIAGILKGFDSNVDMVLSGAVETKGKAVREVGTSIIRGSSVTCVYSSDLVTIACPF